MFKVGEVEQTSYAYVGPDILGQDMEKLYKKHHQEFELKWPMLVLKREQVVNPEDFLPEINKVNEAIAKSSLSVAAELVEGGGKNAEEKMRSLANKNRVCQCGYDKRMEVKVNKGNGQNAYFKKTVRTGFKKRSRCKQCKGCLATKCGRCTPCLRPAMKKPCVDKICLFPVVPKCPCFS